MGIMTLKRKPENLDIEKIKLILHIGVCIFHNNNRKTATSYYISISDNVFGVPKNQIWMLEYVKIIIFRMSQTKPYSAFHFNCGTSSCRTGSPHQSPRSRPQRSSPRACGKYFQRESCRGCKQIEGRPINMDELSKSTIWGNDKKNSTNQDCMPVWAASTDRETLPVVAAVVKTWPKIFTQETELDFNNNQPVKEQPALTDTCSMSFLSDSLRYCL